jgi:transketolase
LIPAGKTNRQQFAETMLKVGQEDPNLVVLVGDISHFALQPFAVACPGRYYNIGICEPTMVGMAAGLSRLGLHPVVHTIAPFLIERSFEQLKLDFCYQKIGGNLVTVGSVFDYGTLGCTHHCYGDFALLKTLPGTEIVCPSTPLEFDVLFRQTYRDPSLTVLRVPVGQHLQEFERQVIHLGKGIKVCDGAGISICVTGPQLQNAVLAREGLVQMGLEPEILYLHTIRPLDTELICDSVRKTRRVMVIEEHMRSGGLGDDILRSIQGLGSIQFTSLSIPDTFIHEYGKYEDHCNRLGLSRDGILNRAREVFGGHGKSCN